MSSAGAPAKLHPLASTTLSAPFFLSGFFSPVAHLQILLNLKCPSSKSLPPPNLLYLLLASHTLSAPSFPEVLLCPFQVSDQTALT